MAEARKALSCWWYGLPILLLACSVGLGSWMAFSGIVSTVKDFSLQRFTAPGKHDVVLPEPGSYTIYHEHRSTLNGKVYSTDGQIGGLACAVRNKRTGVVIPVTHLDVNTTYSVEAREGKGLLSFSVAEPGAYEIDAVYPPGQTGTEAVLGVGKSFGAKSVLLIISGALLGAFGALGSLIFFVLLLVWRSRAPKRNAAQEAVLPSRF